LRGRLGLQIFVHEKNYGYGRNQQTCYREALAAGADIIVMVHPDYQYTPLLVAAMSSMVAFGVYDVVLGSRIVGGGALRGGMPFYKYVANRFLTAFQNAFTGANLSEYHTGFRAFSKDVLANLPLLENSDDFVFDNEMLAQCICFGYRIGELSCPTKYFGEAFLDRLLPERQVRLRSSQYNAQIPVARMGNRALQTLQPHWQKTAVRLLRAH
jgi:glycosyltransferase involved in cell wall biosynthesis